MIARYFLIFKNNKIVFRKINNCLKSKIIRLNVDACLNRYYPTNIQPDYNALYLYHYMPEKCLYTKLSYFTAHIYSFEFDCSFFWKSNWHIMEFRAQNSLNFNSLHRILAFSIVFFVVAHFWIHTFSYLALKNLIIENFITLRYLAYESQMGFFFFSRIFRSKVLTYSEFKLHLF